MQTPKRTRGLGRDPTTGLPLRRIEKKWLTADHKRVDPKKLQAAHPDCNIFFIADQMNLSQNAVDARVLPRPDGRVSSSYNVVMANLAPADEPPALAMLTHVDNWDAGTDLWEAGRAEQTNTSGLRRGRAGK